MPITKISTQNKYTKISTHLESFKNISTRLESFKKISTRLEWEESMAI